LAPLFKDKILASDSFPLADRMALCVAVLAADNSPLLVKSAEADQKHPASTGISSNICFHYDLHTSIDVIEEKTASVSAASASGAVRARATEQSVNRESFLGVLFATERHKVS
jgi:hypothetical protein